MVTQYLSFDKNIEIGHFYFALTFFYINLNHSFVKMRVSIFIHKYHDSIKIFNPESIWLGMKKYSENILLTPWFLLVAILLIGGLFRGLFLTLVPNGLNRDEIVHGYDAYCLLKTGCDHWGQFLPLHFRGFNDYNEALFNYTTVIWVALLGPTDLAIRLTPFFYGMLTILTTYFLAKRLFDNTYVGLFAAFFVAIAPWHIHYSRFGIPGILVPFFHTLGLIFLFKAIDENKPKMWYGCALAFGLSFHTYPIAKLFIPLSLMGIILLFPKELWQRKKQLFLPLILFLIFLAPLVYETWHGEILARAKNISFVHRNIPLTEKIDIFIKNYLSFFSLEFLFKRGDRTPGQWFAEHGQLYWLELPFLLMSIISILAQRTRKKLFLLWWLLVYPIAPSLTDENIPHAIRSSTALPVFQIITAWGAWLFFIWLFRTFRKTSKVKLWIRHGIIIGFVVALGVSLHEFSRKYFVRYPVKHAKYSQYGMKEACHYIRKVKSHYNRIVFTGHISDTSRRRPNIFLAYYLPIDPEKYQFMPKEFTHEAYATKFGKFEVNWKDNLRMPEPGEKVLYVVKENECPGAHVYKHILYPDGNVAFKICEYL